MDTSSPRLARFLAAQRNVDALNLDLRAAEKLAGELRVRQQAACLELRDAKVSLEELDAAGKQLWFPDDDDPPPSPDSPAVATVPTGRGKGWQPGQPINESLAAVLRAIPPDTVVSFSQLLDKLPGLSEHVLRSRVGKAKQYGLLDGAGWGMYRLSESAKGTFGGGLRVVK